MAKSTNSRSAAGPSNESEGAATPTRGRRKPAEIDRADRDPAETAAPSAPRRGSGKGGARGAEARDTSRTAAGSGGLTNVGITADPAPAAGGGRNAEAERMERADIGLSNEQRAGVSQILNRALSDEHVLYIRTRNYHWNITGLQFKSLHEFFEEQYKQLEAAIDEIAERTRSLGFRAIGSMAEFLQYARLPEQNPAEVPDAIGMLRNLLTDHESIIKHLRADIDTCEELHDAGTADFLTAMMEAHEKMAWMIRAFLA